MVLEALSSEESSEGVKSLVLIAGAACAKGGNAGLFRSSVY